jgi:hypothetical protein
MDKDTFLMTFQRRPNKISEIYVDFSNPEKKGTIFLGETMNPEEVAMGLREFADFLDKLGRWSRSAANKDNLKLNYAYHDEGKEFAGWE